MAIRYFHGGAPGRRVEDLLLPSATTGFQNSHFRGQLLKNYDFHRVYITTDQELAIRYASVFLPDDLEWMLRVCRWKNGELQVPRKMPWSKLDPGAVYEVAPTSEPEPDPDFEQVGTSFSCDSARVIRICDIPRRVFTRERETPQDFSCERTPSRYWQAPRF